MMQLGACALQQRCSPLFDTIQKLKQSSRAKLSWKNMSGSCAVVSDSLVWNRFFEAKCEMIKST